jgi:hypothetical protein
MNRFSWCLGALCVVLALASRAGASILIVGTFSGSQEDPPNLITTGQGTFSGTLDVSGSAATLTFSINDTDLIGGDVVGANFGDSLVPPPTVPTSGATTRACLPARTGPSWARGLLRTAGR